MAGQQNSRERLLLLIVCVLVMTAAYVVLMSTGIIEINTDGSFLIDPIEADTVELRHELAAANKQAVADAKIMATDPSIVAKLVHIRNNIHLKSTKKRVDSNRYALYFYRHGELVERWYIDKNGLTTFSSRFGTYTIQGSFDLDYIAGLLQ